jgi:Xaa-Pro aminopeptidase
MTRFPQRRDQLRHLVRNAGAEAILVTNFTNVTYLTGFTGDASFLLLAPHNELLLTDFRYRQQLSEECPGLELAVRRSGTEMLTLTEKVLKTARPRRLAIEAGSMSLAQFSQLSENLPQIEFVPTQGLVEQLREVKDAEEVAEIR